MITQVVLGWSGGKDSCLALAALLADPRYEVVALLTSVTDGGRVAAHGVPYALIVQQAASLGLPVIEMPLPGSPSNEAYEAAFAVAIVRLRARWPQLVTIAFGDLFLEDIREYRERLARSANVTAIFPLWGRDTRTLAREFISSGFRATLVWVDGAQLPTAFAGRTFDERLLAELPTSVDPCGERGEFHTFVYDGPIFESPVAARTTDQ